MRLIRHAFVRLIHYATALRRKLALGAAIFLAAQGVVVGYLWYDYHKYQTAIAPAAERYNAVRHNWEQQFSYRIDAGPLPEDGPARLRHAARTAPPSARVVFVPLLSDYDAAMFRLGNRWHFDGCPLLRTTPSLDGRPITLDMALRLLHWYASEELRKDYQPGALLQWGRSQRPDGTWVLQDEGNPRPDGTWIFECGMSRIAGHGFRVVLSPVGELISIKRVFSPE